MNFKVARIVDLPSPIRHKTNKLEGTQVWAQAVAKIKEGFGELEEAFAVTFTPADAKELGIKTVDRVFANMCRKLIKEAGLSYEVVRYKDTHGNLVVRVADAGATAATKRMRSGEARRVAAG